MSKSLQERAAHAFTPKFRYRLKRAVDEAVSVGARLMPSIKGIRNRPVCNCPEGFLLGKRYPGSPSVAKWCKDRVYSGNTHKYVTHQSFQNAFDTNRDDDTPEAALGLLYRERALEESEAQHDG